MQTIEKVNYHGKDYKIVKSVNEWNSRVLIEIFHGGKLSRTRVSGLTSGFPEVWKLIQGHGWLRCCEILTSWEKLNPRDFLA